MRTTDLVVVGGGASGLAAAAAAIECGVKSVTVLEKRGVLGGNAALAGGIFACGSPVQKREMVDADKDVYFKLFMDWAHWKSVNPQLVRAWINKSGETIQWLQEKGIEFSLCALYPNQLRVGHVPSEGGGRKLVTVLTKYCEDRGVDILRRTAAKRILLDHNRRVSGIVAESRDGEAVQISCRSIVLASGGFSGNTELLRQYCPDYFDGLKLVGIPYHGDGLMMAREAGAGGGERLPVLLEGPTPDCPNRRLLLKFAVVDPRCVWVNKRGERFADETVGHLPFVGANVLAAQPERTAFVIFDERMRRELEKKTAMPAGLPIRKSLAPVGEQAEVLSELRAEAENGAVKIGSTWSEIADWMGAPAQTLSRTVEEYNSYCASGYDKDYAKDRKYLLALLEPPFYAVRTRCVMLDTIGGIKTNANLEVLNGEGTTIPGLYAAGMLVDGFEPETYCAELPASAFGFAVNSGRMAAESAAAALAGC